MFNPRDPGLLQLATWMRRHDIMVHVTPGGIERMVKAYALAMLSDHSEALEMNAHVQSVRQD
jgi:hypothetical protein